MQLCFAKHSGFAIWNGRIPLKQGKPNDPNEDNEALNERIAHIVDM
jgi:hypothetical protein